MESFCGQKASDLPAAIGKKEAEGQETLKTRPSAQFIAGVGATHAIGPSFKVLRCDAW
jgi:hypothetical protein